jgi:hypothetical protein
VLHTKLLVLVDGFLLADFEALGLLRVEVVCVVRHVAVSGLLKIEMCWTGDEQLFAEKLECQLLE